MNNDKLLYHYCSTQTALALLKNRECRLSALSLANDTLEGRVLGKVFIQLLRETNLSPELIDIASVIVEGYPNATEGFAFCLSEKGDLLSQWRSYGRDGSGLSIGFSSVRLMGDFGNVNFGAKFYEVIKVDYGEVGLKESLKPIVQNLSNEFGQVAPFARLKTGVSKERALKILESRGDPEYVFTALSGDAEKMLARFLKSLSVLHFEIYKTKPEHFFEECEWRLLRYSHKVHSPEIDYAAVDGAIRPFISSLIADPAKESIQEVILGPKNYTNIDWMRAFLASVGLQHVLVKRSSIESYR